MRTELEDESLMTLKTNCGKIYSVQQNRLMNTEEIFSTLCVPTKTQFVTCPYHFTFRTLISYCLGSLFSSTQIEFVPSQASAAGSPMVDVGNLPFSAACTLAGNAMHVAQAGAIAIIAAVHRPGLACDVRRIALSPSPQPP